MNSNIPTANGSFTPLLNLYSAFRPLNVIEEYTKRHGDFYRLKVGNNSEAIIVSNPQAIKEIFASAPDTFKSADGNKALNFLLGNNSILLLDGEKHRIRRKLLMPAFYGEFLQRCSEKIIEITNRVSDRLESGGSFAVRPFMQEITLQIILSIVFGIDRNQRYERLKELLVELLETFNTPLKSMLIMFPILQKDWGDFSPWGRFLRLKAEIKQLIKMEIEEKRRSLNQDEPDRDVLSLLLQAKDDRGEGMTREELSDELITLLFAGHETTASALSWLFYWIHNDLGVQDKLRSQLSSIEENTDYRKINNLLYLNAVVSETLRIYPVTAGTFVRILTRSVSILGYELDSNDWLSISIYALHHRQDLYPNPRQFKPERFLTRTYSSSEYIPFGGGNRRCIGLALALMEMKLVTATILSRFRLALCNKRPLYPVRRGITLAPPASFKMVVKSKFNSKDA